MRTLNCLIIEDEHLAAGVIADYIAQVPGLKLVSICPDVFSANELLRTVAVDIIFLDINLPRISGLEFMSTLGTRHQVILTTAYHQYALDGFNANAVDYLLKPIEFSRFLQAINKIYSRQGIMPERAFPAAAAVSRKHYFFTTDRKKVKVYAEDIDYIESLKDYVSIHAGSRKILTRLGIAEMDRMLEDGQFLRIHRSFIVNVSRVTAYSATEVEIGSITLPLGRTYKEHVERRLAE